MKRKLIVLSFMLSVGMLVSTDLKAQKSDSYFSYTMETREETPESGVGFVNMSEGSAPLTGGLLLMTATGLAYLINKRRKDNE